MNDEGEKKVTAMQTCSATSCMQRRSRRNGKGFAGSCRMSDAAPGDGLLAAQRTGPGWALAHAMCRVRAPVHACMHVRPATTQDLVLE
jgi:hypothetical protein